MNKIIFTMSVFLLAGYLRGEATRIVSIHPDRVSCFVYEPFELILSVPEKSKTPTVPSGPKYTVTRISKDSKIHAFRIGIVAEQPGILTIPPFEVETPSGTARTQLLRLPIQAPRPANEMSVSIGFSNTNLLVDQPVELYVNWESKVPFAQCQDLRIDLPLLLDPSWEVYPIEPDLPEPQRIGLPVNDQRVIARLIPTAGKFALTFSYQMVPRKEGLYNTTVRIQCAVMEDLRRRPRYPSAYDNHFFMKPEKGHRYERVYLSGESTTATVRALPEKKRTEYYSGIVGNVSVYADIDPVETVTGQPMLLTVTLTNLPFSRQIRNLPEATLKDLGPEFLVTPDPMHIDETDRSKSFTYIIRPLRSGITRIPALAVDFFDPAKNTYRTARTQSLNITVKPDGKQTVYQPAERQNQYILSPLTGIRNNREEGKLRMNAYQILNLFAHHGLLFWLIPPLFWLILRPWIQYLDRCRKDPVYARAKRAFRRFRRAVRRNEATAWKNYLADRLNLHMEAVTFETVKTELQKQDVPDEIIQSIREQFEKENVQLYAPPGTNTKEAAAIRSLVQKIQKTTGILILALCLFHAQDTQAADTGESLFKQAMNIRMEKPDEAKPLFIEAALEFEPENQFYNAANSWFFANEKGRALANYRSAERRAPFNREICESIDFIRKQQSYSFHTRTRFSKGLSKTWNRFCRWSPSLRFGLLTLFYLAAWMTYIISRLCVKPVPNKVWIITGICTAAIGLSLIRTQFQPDTGVLIQATQARLGPGYAYEPAYKKLLNEAVEFQWLETRENWVQARLPDGNDVWLRKSACVKIK